MITIKDLSLNFGTQEVLRGVNWFISPKSRIGLVGDNGAGKTTLLRVLAGLEDYGSGSVTFTGKTPRIGYLPQDLADIEKMPLSDFLYRRAGLEQLKVKLRQTENTLSVTPESSPLLKKTLSEYEYLQRQFEASGGYSFETEAALVLKGLGFRPATDLKRNTGEFSGGWKMRIALAALLLSRPELLLLDEPTNHLDTESMEWLESWLRSFSGTLISVSHDRRFLENMVSSVAELSGGKITIYSMRYDKFLEEREARRARILAERAQQQEHIEEMQHFIERFRYKATKASQVQSRIRQLEKFELTDLPMEQKSVNFKFPDAPRSGYEVFRANALEMHYGDNFVFGGANFSLIRGEKVALVGVNGAGKSTLLRLVNKIENPSGGTLSFGHNVKREFFSQESSQNLDYSKSVWEEISSAGSSLDAPARRSLLGSFLFSGDDIYKKVSVLSGGEKSRLALAKILLCPSNFLILDEPTNHLDYKTKELFQKALLAYGGTILIVSHDRAFLDNLVSRVLEIRDGKLYDYNGNYSYFIERRAKLLDSSAQTSKASVQIPSAAAANSPRFKTKEEKRLEAEERNRLFQSRKELLQKLSSVENIIAALEESKQELSLKLCDAEELKNSTSVSKMMIEFKNCERKLEENYELWEHISSEIEKIK